MKASELRIGNLVINNRNGKVCEVESLEYEGDTIYVNRDHGWGGEVDYSGCDIAPIPLSEEWLIKFGFVQGDHIRLSRSFYEIPVGGSLLQINPDNGVVWIVREGNIFNNPALIEYVHQLQNLYFALTGEELTIK